MLASCKQTYQDVHVIYPIQPDHLTFVLNSYKQIMKTYLIRFDTGHKMLLQAQIVHHALISQDAAAPSSVSLATFLKTTFTHYN